MKQVAKTQGENRRRSRDRARLARPFDVRVPANSVALVLSRREAVALRRFCNVYSDEEFRDAREAGAFSRAVGKLYDVTALWPSEEDLA